jgi:hypothetical protein
VDQQTTVALLSGGFALAGGLGGVVLSGSLARRADDRRWRAEDQRRWLADRRTTYANFLGLASSMLREIDGIGVFLTDGDKPIPDDDEQLIANRLFEYWVRWDDELQPALGEVELLASPEVADLADRMSGALMELTAPIELRQASDDFYPLEFQAQDLLDVLRNAMRTELGLSAVSREGHLGRRDDEWPWLPDRPPRESYVQSQGQKQIE